MSNRLVKIIVPIIGTLLIIFLPGCGSRVVNNQTNNQFDGIWEMEFEKPLSSYVDSWSDNATGAITFNSILTFEADNFTLQIIAPNSYKHLNKEYEGNYSISAYTIIFNAIYNSYYKRIDVNNLEAYGGYYLTEELQFNFISLDSLKFNVISTLGPDGMMSIPMTSFLWNTSGFWPSMQTSGTYNRID